VWKPFKAIPMRSFITKSAIAFMISTSTLASASGQGPNALKIVSFNIYNRPWERTARLENIVQTVKALDPDIVALQEVATGWILPGGDPAQLLADRLEMHHIRYWHEQNLGIFRTGIAVLSKYPILSAEYHEFSRHDFWDAKGYMGLQIAAPRGTLQFINLHMASTHNESIRSSEWEELAAFAKKLTSQGPVLIAGDFNTEPTDPVLATFLKTTGAANLYEGWPDRDQLRSWTPNYQEACSHSGDPESALLDYLFILPGQAAHSPVLSFGGGRVVQPELKPFPSDHCPVEAQIFWK
jgi:endonuclease/exonuclease/phosphatase family metal-dependent hydrolase